MERALTSLLDVLATLLFAAGLAGGLWPLIGWWALMCSGFLVLVGSAVAERSRPGPPDPRLTEGEVPP
jgi:hypothetical protein